MKNAIKFFLLSVLSCAIVSAQETENTDPVLLVKESQESEVLEMTSYCGEQITDLIPLLEEWCNREFANYPYLWVPAQGEICDAQAKLPSEKNSLVTIVRKEGAVVGVAAAIPFDSMYSKEGQAVMDKAIAQGFDLSKMLYMCYFLTAPECRNDAKLVEMIYNNYLDFAAKLGRTQICYFEDAGREDHPLRPETPTAIEPWGVVIDGFTRMDLQIEHSWPTLQPDGTVRDEAHKADYFYKDI